MEYIDAFTILLQLVDLKQLKLLGGAALDDGSRYEEENEDENNLPVFVKYNRMLHGRNTSRGRKKDALTIKFLKTYIHYAKNRIQPELTDEVFCFQNEFQ